jgi:LPXTG-motif cell wall-anchored protein
MASPKTRANVARVAAAAIFAAGASLAVVGTASADGPTQPEEPVTNDGSIAGIVSGSSEGDSGSIVGVVEGGSEGDSGSILGLVEGSSEGETTEGSSEGETTEGTTEGETAEGTTEGETTEGTTEGETAEGTTEGETTEGTTEGETAEGTTEGETTEGSTGGVNEGTTGNDPEPATEGGGGPIEQEPPTEGDVPVEEVPEEVPAEDVPVEEGDGGELAETGASGNDALLIVGAATMIAGGVAFRYLPRLINKGVTTA